MSQQIDRFRHMRYLKRRSIGEILLLIMILTILIAAFLILLTPRLLDIASLSEPQWSQLSALVSVATFAFTLGAGLSILLQISEANDSRNLDIYKDIYEKMMALDQIEARRHIYQCSKISIDDKGKPTNEGIGIIEKLRTDDEIYRSFKKTLNLIDYFGFLVEREWVTSDEIIGWLSPVVVKIWEKIGPMVEYEREDRPEEPDYYLSAIHLAEKCLEWRDRHYPDRSSISFDKPRY